MEDTRFDTIARQLGSGSSRRSVLKGLFGIGGVAAVGLAAWAFFAPDRPDNRGAQPSPDQSKSEHPTR